MTTAGGFPEVDIYSPRHQGSALYIYSMVHTNALIGDGVYIVKYKRLRDTQVHCVYRESKRFAIIRGCNRRAHTHYICVVMMDVAWRGLSSFCMRGMYVPLPRLPNTHSSQERETAKRYRSNPAHAYVMCVARGSRRCYTETYKTSHTHTHIRTRLTMCWGV